MTTVYKVATGHDIALGSLTAIDPQPRTKGLQYARRSYAASGIVIDELAFVELEWSMIETETQYLALLTQFGLNAATSANVSIYVQDETYQWILRNGKAIRPLIGSDGARENFFIRDITILVNNLSAQP